MSTNNPGEQNPYGNSGDGQDQPGRPQEPQQPYQQQPSYGQPQQPYAQQPPAYGSPYPGGYPQGQNFGPPTVYPDNKLGGWALGLGLASVVLQCGFLTGIPAIIVGVKGMRAAKEGTANNRGMSLAGVIIGIVMTVLSLLAIIFFIFLFAAAGGWAEFQHEFETSLNEASVLAPLLPLSR